MNCGLGRLSHGAEVFSALSVHTGCLRRTKPVSCRLGECHAQPDFPGNLGFLGPDDETMLFSMDGDVRSVFSRVFKTALDRPYDSGASAANRPSVRAKMTSRHFIAPHFGQKSACRPCGNGPSFSLGMTLERLSQVVAGSRAWPPKPLRENPNILFHMIFRRL